MAGLIVLVGCLGPSPQRAFLLVDQVTKEITRSSGLYYRHRALKQTLEGYTSMPGTKVMAPKELALWLDD